MLRLFENEIPSKTDNRNTLEAFFRLLDLFGNNFIFSLVVHAIFKNAYI